MLTFTLQEYVKLLPIIAPVLAGLAALITDVFLPRGHKVVLAYIGFAGCVLAAIAAAITWNTPRDEYIMGGALATSRLGFMLALGVLVGGAGSALYSAHYGEGTTVATGEYFGLMQFAVAGMLALVVANDLATFFVAIETLSISVYALTGINRSKPRGAEGAMKYFLLGAFSSGFLLYGIALVYGATGTLRLDVISRVGFGSGGTVAVFGVALMLIGLLFKVGAVPFHSWVPDAYEGAPAGVTGFMSVAVKAAAFGATLRILVAVGAHRSLALQAQQGAGMHLGWILWILAAVTMIVGNAGAFAQSNPRRLLAYSGIAHTGYALVGLVTIARWGDSVRGIFHAPITELPGADGTAALMKAAQDGAAGVIFYMVGYGVANLAAFAVLCYLERQGEDVDDVQHLAGLAKSRPAAALAMTIAMISLAGVPLTSGFIGKLWVFKAAVAAGDTGLVVLGLLTSALSLGYYLRIVVLMYMRTSGEAVAGEPAPLPRSVPIGGESFRWGARLAYATLAGLTILLGVAPGKLLDLANTGAKALFPT